MSARAPTAADASGRDVRKAGQRTIVALPGVAAPWNRITFTPASSSAPVVVSELGLFADGQTFSDPPGSLFSGFPVRPSIPRSRPTIDARRVRVPRRRRVARPRRDAASGAVARGLLCLAVCVLDLGTMFSPYWSRDIRCDVRRRADRVGFQRQPDRRPLRGIPAGAGSGADHGARHRAVASDAGIRAVLRSGSRSRPNRPTSSRSR